MAKDDGMKMTNRPCSTDFDNMNALFMTTGRKRFFFFSRSCRAHVWIVSKEGMEITEAREGEKGKGEKGNKRESRGSTAFRSI